MVKRFIPWILWAGIITTIAIALLIWESDLLWKVQHLNLFLFSSLFFKQQMIVPGGFLSYLGTFFTQFFYYPWLGVVLLCGWWLLLTWVTKRTFRLADRWNALALLPVSILLINNMELGYWHYILKLKGYFFVPTIGTTVGICLLWAYRKLPTKLWLQLLFMLIVTVVGYPLMGAYALFAVLLMGLWSWRLTDNNGKKLFTLHYSLFTTLVALLFVAVIPLFFYRYVYYQTNLSLIYHAVLPIFAVREEYPEFFTPYYLLAACFVAFVLLNLSKEPAKNTKPFWTWSIQGVIIIVMALGVRYYWYDDENFHHELAMQRCIEKLNWKGVLKEGSKQDGQPTRAIVMMRNLALCRLGRQADEMYDFPKGSARSNTPLPIHMYNVVGRLIYYQYGLPNECHRMCMEEGVEYGWSPELLRYMARCAMLNKELQASRKYLNLLQQTLFYKGWAEHFQTLADPKKLTHNPETGPITHMQHYTNRLDSDNGQVERYLMTILSEHDANDLYFQEQALLGAMWTRDPDDFWARFSHYLSLLPVGYSIPRIYQEAAYLYANMQHKEFIDELPIDESVKKSFHSFVIQMDSYKGAPLNQLRGLLYDSYSNTYFYEYFFLKDIAYF